MANLPLQVADTPSEESITTNSPEHLLKRSFAERLHYTGVLPDTPSLTFKEFRELLSMKREEQFWRIAFFDSLIEKGFLPELQRLSANELKAFVFMDRHEQERWTEYLESERKQRGQIQSPPAQEARKQTKVLARPYKPHEDDFQSMEVRMLPKVREYIDALAAHNGMHAQAYVERVLIDTINKNPDHVENGQQLLKQFGGSLHRVKQHIHEERLARLEALESENQSRQR